MEPLAVRVVFGYGTQDVIGPIGFACVGLGASTEVYQLLLSSANPPICWIIIPLIVVDGSPMVEYIKLCLSK